MVEMNIVPEDLQDQLEKNVNSHDQSKYSKEEFDGYRMRFFPINRKEKSEGYEAFNAAWRHHKENNPHHWECPLWYDEFRRVAKKPMDPVYAYEMVCDWQAMGIKFGNTCLEFFNKSKNSIIIAPETYKLVVKIMNELVKGY